MHKDECCSDLMLSFARMIVTFSREVLFNEDISRIQSEAELHAWEKAEVEKVLAKVGLLETDADDAADFCWAEREHEGWRLEINYEVMVLAGELVPLAYVKFLVLWREAQARLVIVDHLCRNKACSNGVGRVGSVVVEQVVKRYPLSSAMLCTVRAKRPAPFAQNEEERVKAVAVYKRMGFLEMPRKCAVARCLQPLAERPGKRPGWAGPRLAALAGLMAQGAFGDSLPMTEADMRASAPRRIVWWELAGRPGGEAWWAALAAEPLAPPAGLSPPEWLRQGATVEALCDGKWWVAVVAEVQAAGTRGLRARVHYVGVDGAASGQVARRSLPR